MIILSALRLLSIIFIWRYLKNIKGINGIQDIDASKYKVKKGPNGYYGVNKKSFSLPIGYELIDTSSRSMWDWSYSYPVYPTEKEAWESVKRHISLSINK